MEHTEATSTEIGRTGEPQVGKLSKVTTRLWNDRYIYLLLLPGVLFFVIYKYVPMLGLVIAFQDYNPFRGFLHSSWVGFDNFQRIFADAEVLRVIRNTLLLSFLQVTFAFPVPIVLALMLNELRLRVYKRTIQSIVYLPHFISWVVVIGIVTIFLRSEGLVSSLLHSVFGIAPIPFLTDPRFFMPLVVLEVIWKDSGWGTIILLAAMAGVDPQLYEAATMVSP